MINQDEDDDFLFTAGATDYLAYKKLLCVENRFIVEKKYQDYFDQIIDRSKKKYSVRDHLYRARLNSFKQNYPFRANEMGIAPKSRASVGRANPHGIPYMYLAEASSTAIAEVRPNVNDYVSVATFEIIDTINVASLEDITVADSPTLSTFMFYLSYDFSKSAHDELDYLPCQYFAEYCKSKKIDGIRYLSSAKGFPNSPKKGKYNVVLFNDGKVKCKDSDVKAYQITCIDYMTKSISN